MDIYDKGSKTIVKLDGEDVSQAIRSMPVTENVNAVSAMKYVRQTMVEIQRNIGKKTNCVVEGRDIGTVVFPDAEFKIFMVADVNMRAERRFKDLYEMGENRSFQEVLADLKRRDEKDSTRAYSPLQKADEAIEIDTSMLSIDQQVEKIINLVKKNN